MEDDAIRDELAKLVQPLKRLYDGALEEKEELLVRVAANRDKLDRLKKAIKAVAPEVIEDKPPKRKGDFNVSVEKQARVFEAVRDGAETMTAIREATGFSTATVSKAIDKLRDREMVRRAGRDHTLPGNPYRHAMMPHGNAVGLPIEGVALEGVSS